MKSILALVAVLVLAAAPAMATVTLGIGDVTWGANTLSFAVVIASNDGADTSTYISGFGAGVVLSLTPEGAGLTGGGGNATAFSPVLNGANAFLNNRTPAYIGTLVGANWAFPNFDQNSDAGKGLFTAGGSTPYTPYVSFDIDGSLGNGTADLPTLSSLGVGSILGYYEFQFTGSAPAALYASIGAENPNSPGAAGGLGYGTFTDGGGGVLPLVAGAQNVPLVPEPATMGLLGLGLVGLVIRRKKA